MTQRHGTGFLQWFMPYLIGVMLSVGGCLLLVITTMIFGVLLGYVGLFFLPYLFLVCLLLWALPFTRYRVAWAGPIVAWLLCPLAFAALIGGVAPLLAPNAMMVLLVSALFPIAMILGWTIHRRSGGKRYKVVVDERDLVPPRAPTS